MGARHFPISLRAEKLSIIFVWDSYDGLRQQASARPSTSQGVRLVWNIATCWLALCLPIEPRARYSILCKAEHAHTAKFNMFGKKRSRRVKLRMSLDSAQDGLGLGWMRWPSEVFEASEASKDTSAVGLVKDVGSAAVHQVAISLAAHINVRTI